MNGKKTVRIYLATSVDVEFDGDDFSSNRELSGYAREFWSEYIDQQQVMENLIIQEEYPPQVFD